ncbi:hypothetical protein GCM10009821_25120 [Aeromicrobium halocynthiae]|uniref:Uncharacterized protein n=1 Tax=Aeromicrobium halocynthiae TaxID=560557 RepID=A0ABN2W417_9ACTN
MAPRRDRQAPSPLLTEDEVQAVLTEGLAAIAGRGAAGARIGTSLTRLDGEQRTIRAGCTDDALRTVRDAWFGGAVDERRGPVPGLEEPRTVDDTVQLVGVVGSGVGGMNPCVVQLVWTGDVLLATAHAKEGRIRQGTCRKALDSLERVVGR